MERVEVAISGFTPPSKENKKRCPTHPYCAPGGCGFWLGMEHGQSPEPVRVLVTEVSGEEKKDIIDWTLAHQATRHRIVAMNEMQYKKFKRTDKIGIVELPNYIKEETPIQATLRSHEIPKIIA